MPIKVNEENAPRLIAHQRAQLLDLTRQRNFLEVIAVWNRAAAEVRYAEIPSRLAAAACAQSGDLPAAALMLRRVVVSPQAEPATLALAGLATVESRYTLDRILDLTESVMAGVIAQRKKNRPA